MTRIVWIALLLAACGRQPQAASDTAGARLEAAATQAGLVADPRRATLVGSWGQDTDRLCVTPLDTAHVRIGALIDYGAGQGCVASGIGIRKGQDTVSVAFGACRFDARFDGERIAFPVALPAACDRLCTGHATLSALSVAHLSAAVSEAETLRSPSGKLLCAIGQ